MTDCHLMAHIGIQKVRCQVLVFRPTLHTIVHAGIDHTLKGTSQPEDKHSEHMPWDTGGFFQFTHQCKIHCNPMSDHTSLAGKTLQMIFLQKQNIFPTTCHRKQSLSGVQLTNISQLVSITCKATKQKNPHA